MWAATPIWADFSYEQTSTITGGAMMGMVKVMGVFSKKLREPMRSQVMVKGDQMVNLSPDNAQIIDLSKETITSVDFQKKTYAVITFDEMRRALDEMARKMQGKKDPQQPEMQFDVSVKDTGDTQTVNGLPAKRVILTIKMEGQDQKSGEKGSFDVVTDMWLSQQVSGYDQVQRFYQRMAERMNWTPGSGMMTGMPNAAGMSKGMAQMYRESSKLEGVPVRQIVRMGASGQMRAQGAPPPAQAQRQEQQQQEAAPSVGQALGRIGGLGRLGGLGRKKKEEPPPQAQQQQPEPQTASGAPAATGSPSAPGSLMEMTIESSNFSNAPVDASKFAVPAGFKQVEHDMIRATR
jgi:hypothetical protein